MRKCIAVAMTGMAIFVGYCLSTLPAYWVASKMRFSGQAVSVLDAFYTPIWSLTYHQSERIEPADSGSEQYGFVCYDYPGETAIGKLFCWWLGDTLYWKMRFRRGLFSR